MKKLVVVAFIFIYFIFFVAKSTFAQVIFTEVYPQPLPGESEWLELANQTNQTVNLLGWTIEDLLSTPKAIYVFPNFDLLPYHLLVASVSSQLNNAGDGVVLKDNLGQVIATMNYDSSSLGKSWSLVDEGAYAISTPSAGWHHHFLLTSGVDEPMATVAAQASPSPMPIVSAQPTTSPSPSASLPQEVASLMPQLHKISICPKTGPEWLEWFNPYNTNVQTSLLIKDLQNNSLKLELQLPPSQKITTPLSRNIFNNSGDEIFVYYQDNLLVSQKIPACVQEDMIFSLIDQSTSLVAEDTPNIEVGDLAFNEKSQKLSESAQKTELAAKFNFPQSVLVGLMGSEALQIQPESSGSTGSILSEQVVNSTPSRSNFFSAGLLILGGFLWLGLGIIEIYGQQIFGHQAVDQGFFASNSLG